MLRFFAFLRAINAGRQRAVRMHVLQQAFESLGFSGVATFLGSGNVVFETRTKDVRTLEKRIKRKLQHVLGYSVPVFIRTHPELKKIAALEPFEHSQGHGVDLNVILLGGNLAKRSKARLMSLVTENDGFSIHGRQIYWWRRKKPGRSLYSTVPLAKALSRPFTIRSTKTIKRLAAKWP
jgi:uncharacterized protein (DUF1697 family)